MFGCRPRLGFHPAPMAWLCVLLLVVALSVPASADPVVHLVKDIHQGKTGSMIREIVDVAGTLYFAADDGTHGYELERRHRGRHIHGEGPVSRHEGAISHMDHRLWGHCVLQRQEPFDRTRAVEERRVTCRPGYSP